MNDNYTEAALEMIDLYEKRYDEQFEKALWIKKHYKEPKISNEFLTKIKYAFATVTKIFAISILKIHRGFVQFDTYQQFKDKHHKKDDELERVNKQLRSKANQIAERAITIYENKNPIFENLKTYIKECGGEKFVEILLENLSKYQYEYSFYNAADALGISIEPIKNYYASIKNEKNANIKENVQFLNDIVEIAKNHLIKEIPDIKVR